MGREHGVAVEKDVIIVGACTLFRRRSQQIQTLGPWRITKMVGEEIERDVGTKLPAWPVYLIGAYIIVWSILNIGGGWFPIYAGAYFGSQFRNPEVREEIELWVEELVSKYGEDRQRWRGIDWQQQLQELERSGGLPTPLATALPLARKLAPYMRPLMYIYVPFGLLAAVSLMIFRRWGWWCGTLWLGTWIIISLITPIAFGNIANVFSISLTAVNVVITGLALWSLWIRRDMYSPAGIEPAQNS